MTTGSPTVVFWILGPLFLAVGAYLIWFQRRRRQMLAHFARAHHFSLRPESTATVQAVLDRHFTLSGEGLLRHFGTPASLISAGPAWIFRSVELRDLNPYGRAQSTHFARIVALFEAAGSENAFFRVEKSGAVTPQKPGDSPPPPATVDAVKQTMASAGARHALSVTLSDGYGLLYFEPRVTGGETQADVAVLQAIASQLQNTLPCPKRINP